jgi:hypothetical protein
MAEQQDSGMSCGGVIVIGLVCVLIGSAVQTCSPTPEPRDEPAERNRHIEVYNTPEAKKTRDDIRRFERDHNLKPYDEEN